MIDLCSHILDGTGCGPESYAESLEMCQAAVEGGASTVVATPLWSANSVDPPLPFDEIDNKIERMNKVLTGILTVRRGFVFEFSPSLPELTERYGKLVTLGGKRHILISLPSTRVPAETNDVWAALARQGYTVIISHPECSASVRRNPTILSAWAARGIKFQFEAASVAGAYGREVRKFALECLQKFGSNAVVASNVQAGRVNHLGRARAILIREIGERQAIEHLTEIPKAVIDGLATNLKKGPTSISSLNTLLKVFRPLPADQKEV
jgi:protein-tyrosine phosphatase